MSADSNGCAAAFSLNDAIVRGFLELVERDAVGIWWFNRIRRSRLPRSVLEIEPIKSIASWQRRYRRSVHLIDLTTDMGIPVVAASSFDENGRGIALGFGCAFDLGAAAARATVEMMQFHVQVNFGLFLRTISRIEDVALHTQEIWRWFLETSTGNAIQVVPTPPDARKTRRLDTFSVGLDPIGCCLEAAERAGLEVLTVDLTRPEIGVPVARVIVPGLRSMKPRFGPGRLYDVPVALGWRVRASREADLNPQTIPV